MKRFFKNLSAGLALLGVLIIGANVNAIEKAIKDGELS